MRRFLFLLVFFGGMAMASIVWAQQATYLCDPAVNSGNFVADAATKCAGVSGGKLTTDATFSGSSFTIAPSAAAGDGIAPVVSTAAEANHVLKGSAGNLYGFQVTTGASAGYVLVFNATSAPVDGAVTPVKCYQVSANSTLGASWAPGPPAYFSTGITVSFSTTGCFTKTASATAFISGEVK